MGQAPSSVGQAVFLVVLVLPGITYQFLRERWRGPVPGERELGQRVLRAVIASIVLDTCYALVAGPQLLGILQTTTAGGPDELAQRSRTLALLGLSLFLAVPAGAAAAVSWWRQRRLATGFRATPTAWDHAFHDRGPCFIRARLSNGGWAGGWYGKDSYASSFPNPGELFLQSAYRMNPDGSFVGKVADNEGIYLRAEGIDALEFLTPPPAEGADRHG